MARCVPEPITSKNTKNITLSHPLERLRIPPQTRKNKPAKGAQRDHQNHEPINQLPIIGDHNKLVAIRQTHGAQRVTKVHDPKDTKSTTNNCNTTIVMTIKDLEKEIEQYNDNHCINKQMEKLDAHRIAMPQINKINPTKKYPVHKEQKDIREQPIEQPKENWVNQKYNRKLHEYFTNKLLPEDFNECVKKLRKQIQANEFRKKYIGITIDGKWSTIVKAALLTQSNILQIFLSYKGV
ncbi:hypothetical protein F8M41_016391, partial [Gigaspora margarita]